MNIQNINSIQQKLNLAPTFQAKQNNQATNSNNPHIKKMAFFSTVAILTGLGFYSLAKKGKVKNTNSILPKIELPTKLTDEYFVSQGYQLTLRSSLIRHSKLPDETLFWLNPNNADAIPNLSENSLYKEFKRVPRLSDKEAQLRLKTVSQQLREEISEKYAKLGRYDLFTDGWNLHGIVYDSIRATNYTVQQTLNCSDVAVNINSLYCTIVKQTNKYGTVENSAGWTWRISNNYDYKPSKYRISLNAKIDDGFIQKLDYLLSNANISVKYKIPSSIIEARHRSDTFNIYFAEEPSNTLKQKICKLAKKYIRADEGHVGTKLANGIYEHQEPKAEDIRDFAKICCAINPLIYKHIVLTTSDFKYSSQSASVGEIEAGRIILQRLLK